MNNLNYNAESGWNALGTGLFNGQGAFDESTQPKYARIFSRIEGEPLRNPTGAIDQDILTDALTDFANTRSSFGLNQNNNLSQNFLDGLVGGVVDQAFAGIPTNSANLAGKYLTFI